MKRVRFSFLILFTLMWNQFAYSDCKDLILRMKDPKGGEDAREITSFMNCHGGSYYFPGATTVHMFEWKDQGGARKLCQTTRVCGNAQVWRGRFSAGAMWTMGDYVTDILRDTEFRNNFTQLAEGGAAGQGGDGGDGVSNSAMNTFIQDNAQHLCVNSNHNSVKIYGQGGNVRSGRLNCYQKAAMDLDQWKSWEEDMVAGGYASSTTTDITSPNIGVVCKAGDGGPGLGHYTGNVSIPAMQDCRAAGVTAVGGHGGPGGSGYAPSFGVGSGSSETSGTSETDVSMLRLHVNFAGTYENIKRYCSEPDAEWCY